MIIMNVMIEFTIGYNPKGHIKRAILNNLFISPVLKQALLLISPHNYVQIRFLLKNSMSKLPIIKRGVINNN